MFSDLIHDSRREELLKIFRLLQVFEVPLLWDGKSEDELTGTTDLKNISFNFTEAQKISWKSVSKVYGEPGWDVECAVDRRLLEQIRELRISRQSDAEERLKIAQNILCGEIMSSAEAASQTTLSPQEAWPFPTMLKPTEDGARNGKSKKDPVRNATQSRMVLFEIMRSIFSNGGLTDSRKKLLQMVSVAYDIDGESFNELLAQAAALHKEMKRSINLVLE